MGSRKHPAGPLCGMDKFLKNSMNAEELRELRVTVTVQGLPCMGTEQECHGRGCVWTAQNWELEELSLTNTKYQCRASRGSRSAQDVCQVSWEQPSCKKLLGGQTITDIRGGQRRDRCLCPKIR